MIVPIFLPHLGCGERCTYCDQDIITDIGEVNLEARIAGVLASRKGSFEVGLYGGNIFGLTPPVLRRLFSCFYSEKHRITGFRISTKPVPLNPEVIEILKGNRVAIIELGIPTFNDTTLNVLNRGHTAEDLRRAVSVLKSEGFGVALQVMTGLPDETMADIRETAENIVCLAPSYIRIYPLVVLAGTRLADTFTARRFEPIFFEEVVERTVFIYLAALKAGVKTVKMGLTDNEVIKERIIGGSYHPAFGSIVKSTAFYLAVMANLSKHSLHGEVLVTLNGRDIPHLIGHKRANLKRFRERGVLITWETSERPPDTFVLACGNKAIDGDIFDGLDPAVSAIDG
ncbi:MAG: Oxygen-independent coproporphyrinogen-III oxidase 1 [Syntrophorhabdus sp. PtaU1.Bin153]|nr:MAG: Oxygen-independent coproporphyrinogen-III oxidase 1 [Syntrophorhabdus sp. PtaU1.Bin153]